MIPRLTTSSIEDAGDVDIVALIKPDGEKYVYIYPPSARSRVLRLIGRHAANDRLSLTWHDAAMLSQKVRKQCE